NLASAYNQKGWFDKAEPVLKEAQRIYGQLLKEQPGRPEHMQALGRCCAILGMSYRGQTSYQKAELAEQQALQVFEKLAEEHPDVPDYAYDVGRCYMDLGMTAHHLGRQDTAVGRYDKAISTLESVIRRGLMAARIPLISVRIYRSNALAAS